VSISWFRAATFGSGKSADFNLSTVVGALHPVLPFLKEVELQHPSPDQIPLLAGLPPLARLVVTNPSTLTEATELLWKEMTNLIARSRDTLRELELANAQPQKQGRPNSTLEDLLTDGTGLPTAFPKLRSLSLDAGLAGCSASTALPQFSVLQSVSLTNVFLNPSWAQETETIFSALQQSQIHLRQVSAPGSLSLINYLASYEGVLQEVEIEDPERNMNVNRTALALQFWQEVIPKHQASLKNIALFTSFDDGWAFGDSDSTTSMFINPLPRLEQVDVAVFMTGTEVNKFVSESHYILCSAKNTHAVCTSANVLGQSLAPSPLSAHS
jgi:hypothetical protein